jgi:hypothetical protein
MYVDLEPNLECGSCICYAEALIEQKKIPLKEAIKLKGVTAVSMSWPNRKQDLP